jgi:hypothetical protein
MMAKSYLEEEEERRSGIYGFRVILRINSDYFHEQY